jgi:hypothetical protein
MKVSKHALLLFFAGMFFSASCFGTPLTGTVKSKEGQPLSRISVYSFDDRGTMAPKDGRRFDELTDSRGRFSLRNHGRVVYFGHRDFQPLAKVIDYSTSRVNVVLEAEHNNWDVPLCAGSTAYQKNKDHFVSIQSFLYPSLFLPQPRGVKFKKVRDVDYELYIFAYGPSEQGNVLQGWFGLNAADYSVSAESLVKSTNFKERWAKFGDVSALEIYGQSMEGKYWRYLSFDTSALFYKDASKEAADVFDDMLQKICYQPSKL